MKNLHTFDEFLNENLNESLSVVNLKVGSIYHLESFNSEGDNISMDLKFLGKKSNGDFKFEIVKSYADDKAKKRYDKVDASHWYKVGFEFSYTVQAVNHYIKNQKLTEK